MSDKDNTKAGELIEAPELTIQQPGQQIVPLDPATATPVSLLSQALAQGLDTDTLEKFMDLQERYEAGEARKAYAADMAKAQAKMQPIVAKAENDHTSSYYAKLGTITASIAPIYGRYGFSVSFGQGIAAIEGEIRTTARCLHKLGHVEEFYVDFPPDNVGSGGKVNKTAIHARQSSNTYGKRSIVMGIFNLSILSEDDDAQAAGGSGAGFVTEEQALQLHAMVEENGLIHSAIYRELGIRDYETLAASKFEKAEKRIRQLVEARQR